ncbi:transposase [Pedobacter planticolens]|nr:transposase [Pedobacter planticolens]
MERKYKFFIGIDVSKLTLDFAVNLGIENLIQRKITNDKVEIIDFIKEIKSVQGLRLSNTLFVMEHTGIYCTILINCLEKCKASFVVESASHIKKSMGTVRGKTDGTDALMLANFLFRAKEKIRLWEPKRPIISELSLLSSLRNKLLTIQNSLLVQKRENELFKNKSLCNRYGEFCTNSVIALKTDLKQLDLKIKETCLGDEHIKRLTEIITSIPAVGDITAIQLIILSNEFKSIPTAKKFACYAGVAPFPRQSGTSLNKRSRVSQIANKKIKSLLHLCALGASRFDPDLKKYYLRKTEVEGKNKMLVLNAVRDKLIQRVYACVKQDRCYIKEYMSKLES